MKIFHRRVVGIGDEILQFVVYKKVLSEKEEMFEVKSCEDVSHKHFIICW